MKNLDLEKRAARIIEAVNAKDNNARDVRDAAHEIAHVLQIRRGARAFRGPYERENIHRQLERLARRDAKRNVVCYEAQLIVYEFEARAVEWLVCEALKVPYEVDYWVDTMLLETIRTLGTCPPGGVDGNRNHIERFRKRSKTLALVEKVLSL